jgi:hypothetical protein
MSVVFAIDPGTTHSGWVLYASDGYGKHSVLQSGVDDNHELLVWVRHGQRADTLAIEMIAGMGMTVGQTTFDTCRWIGRFQQAWREPEKVRFVFRRDVKLELCGDSRAKDSNIRQALIDRIGLQGTKKEPGPTYGVKSHAWSALAVAVTVMADSQPKPTAAEGVHPNGIRWRIAFPPEATA